MNEAIIFISQVLLVFFKHLAIRSITNHKRLQTAIYTTFIQASWLISSALGINALLNGEWLSVFVYIAGGVVGSMLQFRIKI